MEFLNTTVYTVLKSLDSMKLDTRNCEHYGMSQNGGIMDKEVRRRRYKFFA